MVKRKDDEELELFKKKTKLPKEPKKKRLPRSLSRLSSGHIRGGRRPNLKAPAHASTRPKSAAGKVTFHFALTYVSKGTKKLASKTKPAGTAAAHVKYIEREQAMAPVAPEAISRALFTRTGAHSTSSQDVHSSTEIGRLDPIETPELSKDSAAYSQNYVEDGNLDSVKKVPSSFGNTGSTRDERVEFWNEIEKMERVNGRVQYRLIVELPVELNAEARLQIMQEFAMTELESKGLGFWAVIHAPDKHNDARNYHGHLIFTDRPVARLPDGRWDFSVVETRKTTRGMIDFRDLKQPKLREMTGLQGKQWVAGMRKSFADISNKVMEAHKVDKRYDHRTYKEMGINKAPTAHLGTKNAAKEAQGIPTPVGISNAARERSIVKDMRLNEATVPVEKLVTQIAEVSNRLGTKSILFQNETNSKELLNARQDYMAASEAKVEAQLDKAERLIRIERRHRFLTDELATSVPDREYNKARRSEIEEERADLAPLYQAAILEQQADQDRIDAASQKMERALARMNSILEELKKVEADVNSRGNDKKGFDVLGPRSWYRDPTDVVPSPCSGRRQSRPLERRRFAGAGGVKPGQWIGCFLLGAAKDVLRGCLCGRSTVCFC